VTVLNLKNVTGFHGKHYVALQMRAFLCLFCRSVCCFKWRVKRPVNGRGRNSEKNEEWVRQKALDPSSSGGFVNLTSQGINQTRRQGCDLKSVALYCVCSENSIQFKCWTNYRFCRFRAIFVILKITESYCTWNQTQIRTRKTKSIRVSMFQIP
jgi:hypothetical protein